MEAAVAPLQTTLTTTFVVNAACVPENVVPRRPSRTGAGVVPAVPVDCPPLPRMEPRPTIEMPEMRMTPRPPPLEDACDAVQVVELAAVMSELRTQAVKTPVVEKPVRSTSICV